MHNKLIEESIIGNCAKHKIDCVVLAQLSMSIFKIQHPDPVSEFGVPVLCSGEEGFLEIKKILEEANSL